MKKILLMIAVAAALVACKPSNPKAPTRPVGNPGMMTQNKQDDGLHLKMVGPRMGFDGKLKLGCCSLGYGF